MKTLQFELWQECNNKCTFCYLGKENRKTPDELKLESLNNALTRISDMSNYPEYQCIGFIGGEFFQGQLKNPEVRELFFKLIEKTAELYNNKIIEQVWITATMTIGDQSDMYEALSYFNDHSGVWITTSWDSIGRFKNPKMEDTWKYHMKHLREKYPSLKVNTTTILTGDLIDKYLNNEFTFRQLSIDWDTSFFFKQCGTFTPINGRGSYSEFDKAKMDGESILPNFFPTRANFLKFLIKFSEQEPRYMWDRLFNINLRADTLIRNYNDGRHVQNNRFKNEAKEVDDANQMECGHPFVYCTYKDSHKCIMCDKLSIAASLGL